jgi:hypothetical protein
MHNDSSIKVPYYIKITLYTLFFVNGVAIEAFPKKKGLFSIVIMLCFHVLYQYQHLQQTTINEKLFISF